jgi:hypothetical protein
MPIDDRRKRAALAWDCRHPDLLPYFAADLCAIRGFRQATREKAPGASPHLSCAMQHCKVNNPQSL